jgi:hypothetical protein
VSQTGSFQADRLKNVLHLELSPHEAGEAQSAVAQQLFTSSYQCQSCQQHLEAFLLRKNEFALSIEGRSPMEHIEVPSFFPKAESKYLRDAEVAANSGKTLAAIFYLRTFVEQYVRRMTGQPLATDVTELLDAYSQTLPLAQRDQMPALGTIYSHLSIAIHSASEDADVFTTCRADLERHFDFRRLFGLNGTSAGARQNDDLPASRRLK